MSSYEYSKGKINSLIKEYDLPPARMEGVHNDLLKIKPVIENIYDKYIFYLSYWKEECAYHGWDWSKDDGSMSGMAKITDGITNRFLEIYALILAGLGENME